MQTLPEQPIEPADVALKLVPDADDIFSAAIELATPAERAAYIDRACAGDERLFKLVQDLVNAYFRAGNFLESPAAVLIDQADRPIQEAPGTPIGRYKLLEQIGEGGFAVVFMAEQESPVRRKVALKIVKAGMDTKQIVTRFEAERQALAMMDHPSIAKVFDAGATDAGRPYFVMELVKGIPITDYSDQHDLNIDQRLDLFMQVCQAVQHAHQKGVIHRDLKPTNVLVSTHDGLPLAKVIDFGIAKATEVRLTEKTLFTDFRQLIGTPAYMSPEQADGSLDIDTRSDVYSLGALLYALLVGVPPFDPKELRSKSFTELQRTIREVDPPPPSKRLDELSKSGLPSRTEKSPPRPLGEGRGEGADDPARQAGLTAKQLRGELDWIIMRALDKDRNRRYQTAAALADDLQRFLADQPVEARRPTRSYRLKKFIRRNKVGMLAGSAIFAALAVGLILAFLSWLQARQQTEIARTQAARSEQVAQFLKNMLKGVGPSVALGRDTKLLREILDNTAARMQKDLVDDPAVQAELCYTLGATYMDLSDYQHAEPMFQIAVDQYRRAFGNVNTNVALALAQLGSAQTAMNKPSVGMVTAGKGVEIARKCGDKGVLAHCLYRQAQSFAYFSTVAEETPILREATALEKEVGDDPSFLGVCMLHLASCLDESGTRAEAESLMRETLALDRKHLDPNDRQIYSDLFLLAQCLLNEGKRDEAEAAAREVLEFDRRVLDKDHVGRVLAVAFLGHVLMVRGKWDQAETLFKEALDASPSNARYWELLGELNARRGHWQTAAEQYSRVVELDPSEDGNRGPSFLAVALVKTGRYDEYRQHCHRFLERASGTHEFGVADKAAKAALLLPVDGADFDRACQLADFAATATQPASLQRWVRFGKALAEYRRGHFESAIDWTDRANSSSNERTSPARAGNYFIQACAYGRLRQMESARAALAKGNAFVQQAREEIPVDFYGNWGDWTIADLLRQEAEKLLAEKPAAEAGSQK